MTETAIKRSLKIARHGLALLADPVLVPLSRKGARRPAFLHYLRRVSDPDLIRYPREICAPLACGCVVCGSSRDLIVRYLYLLGLWEPSVTAYVLRHVSYGDNVVDFGANLGYYPLLLSHSVGTHGKIIAVEASSAGFHALESNIRANHLRNVDSIKLAVAGHGVTEVTLTPGPPENPGETHGRSTGTAQGVKETVAAVSVRELFRDAGLERNIRLIKVDIEGMEIPILHELLDAPAILPQVVDIVVEVTPVWYPRGRQDLGDLLARYRAAGFDVFQFDNGY